LDFLIARMKTAKAMSGMWSSWPALAASLNRMAETAFNDATSDFRNEQRASA